MKTIANFLGFASQRFLKMLEQLGGRVNPGHVMTRPRELQGLCTLPASHIENSQPPSTLRLQDLPDLGGHDVLTDYVSERANDSKPLIDC